jgi:hypothetical protein
MSDYRILELALFDVSVSHYDGGKRRVDTWAARCMSAGGRAGKKDAILENGQATLRVLAEALTELTRQLFLSLPSLVMARKKNVFVVGSP